MSVSRASLLFWFLIRYDRFLQKIGLGRITRILHALYDRQTADFEATVHGFPVRLNGGNRYPFYVRDIPSFNRPLVELVRLTCRTYARPLKVLDVGASLGNTVLLLQEHTPECIEQIHCIEAEETFVRMLKTNTSRFPNVYIHEAMLARSDRRIPGLVKQHPGTATAVSPNTVSAKSLDSLFAGRSGKFDIVKVDIDGSDGEALGGSIRLLQRDQPAVIFEWHPALLRNAGNSYLAHFEALQAAGYGPLLWFGNLGHFSHFGCTQDPHIPTWEHFLVRMQPHGDPHFDIVALPPGLAMMAESLASLGSLPPTDNVRPGSAC